MYVHVVYVSCTRIYYSVYNYVRMYMHVRACRSLIKQTVFTRNTRGSASPHVMFADIMDEATRRSE